MRGITQWNVRDLQLYDNHRATLVKEIAHIHFTALTWLDLGGNWIESIEGLPQVQMPHIRRLFLYGNRITSVAVMRKAAWPDLQLLDISDNSFRATKSLAFGCFLQIKQLYVYCFQIEDEDRGALTELCLPAQMQATSLKYLYINKDNFCFKRSVAVLRQRWPDLKIK